MRVIKKLDHLPLFERQLAIALGNFDGVHIGHQHLLKEMVSFTRRTGTIPAVFLFHPHPQQVLNSANAPKLLLDLDKKISLFESFGIQVVFIIPFDTNFAALTPEGFVRNVLVDKLRVYGVFAGFNYRFGYAAAGTTEMLVNYGEKYGFIVSIIPPVLIEGTPVSSTQIRLVLSTGDIRKARNLLGYWPLIRGVIARGDGRGGRLLGFPTANIEVSRETLVPCSGVYAGRGQLEGKYYAAVMNIGYHPTFCETKERLIEVHLLNYEGSAYGKILEVEIYRKIRDERKFAAADDLARQIGRDIQDALEVYKNLSV